jgi:chemotaxis protein histidine kinase CheA
VATAPWQSYAHKGSIEFSSEDDKGTEFILKIPTSLESEGN